jgi:AraC-like DNA-binding protein/Tfp pilus assembly protein PilF
MISKFSSFSSQQLLDTADYYFDRHSTDTALVCYSLLINTPEFVADQKQQKIIIEAYNASGVIYLNLCDYRAAYESFINALVLCEKANYENCKSRIYNNIGNIYSSFNKFDLAESYYLKALQQCQDSIGKIILLNNLGAIELDNGDIDTAFYYLHESLQMSKRNDDIHSYSILNNLGLYYQKEKQFNAAFHYFRLSLKKAKMDNSIVKEAEVLSNLGSLFFEVDKIDSALFYIGLSNAVAGKNNFLKISAENYLILSKIEKSKGRNKSALEFFEKYAGLKDSIFNVEKFGEINQLQRLYEISKTNQQIEQLVIEKKIKGRTIYYQKIIWFITLGVLLLVSIGFLLIYLQKRNLSTAYKALFDKNLEIIDLKEHPFEKDTEKFKKNMPDNEMQNELLDRIFAIMENISIICDPKFTIDKLAVLAESNNTYVSQVINNVLKKNFRSFLNGYRIQEAQRLFSAPDIAKYTIEAVALNVGFRSRSAFRDAFKEITGVRPNLYIKLMQEQNNG